MRRLMLDFQLALRAPSRNPRMSVVLGRLLGAAFVICFFTGLYSHFLQNPLPWMSFPTHPYWLYQVSQGTHITAGIACFPLILGKLYAVFPNLFQTPPIKSALHVLERASITLFVSASIVEITIGLLDTFQWYPFPFYFKQVHFALAFVVIGSLAIHIAAKLPTIQRYWLRRTSYDADGNLVLDPEDAPLDREAVGAASPSLEESDVAVVRRVGGVTERVMDWIDSAPTRQPRVSRRGFLTAVGVSTAAVVALTAGQSYAVLNRINVFAPRQMGFGPLHLPVNRTAKQAQVTETAMSSQWSLAVTRGSTTKTFTRAELLAMTQAEEALPIACVEGWSQMATWRGVRLHDLMEMVGRLPGEGLTLTSLEKSGAYRVTSMGPEYVQDDRTLVALELNGETLDVDHGYPARMIAPGRPGVLQTKWLSTIEVAR